MFGYTYKLAETSKPGVVKLTPTLSTYAKAFGPALVIWAVVGAAVAAQNRIDKQITVTRNGPNVVSES